MKLSDILLLLKGKRAAVGEIRNWKGGSYIKTPTGWKPHEKQYSKKYVERKNNAAGKKESDLKHRQSEVSRLSGEIQGHKAAVEHHTAQNTKQDERQAKHHAIRAQVKQRRLDKHKEILAERHGVKDEIREPVKKKQFNFSKPLSLNSIQNNAWGKQPENLSDDDLLKTYAYVEYANYAIRRNLINAPTGKTHILPQIGGQDNLNAFKKEIEKRGLNDSFEIDIDLSQTPVKSPEAKVNFEKWKAERQEEKPTKVNADLNISDYVKSHDLDNVTPAKLNEQDRRRLDSKPLEAILSDLDKDYNKTKLASDTPKYDLKNKSYKERMDEKNNILSQIKQWMKAAIEYKSAPPEQPKESAIEQFANSTPKEQKEFIKQPENREMLELESEIKRLKDNANYMRGNKRGSWGKTTNADQKRQAEISRLESRLSNLKEKSNPTTPQEQPKPKDNVIQSGSRGATIAGQQYSKREVDILNSLDDIIGRAKSPVVQDLLKKRQAAKIELPSKELGQPKLAAHENKFMELVKRNRSQADKQAGYPEERRKVEAETGVKIPREKAVEMTKHMKASFIWDIKKPSLIR